LKPLLSDPCSALHGELYANRGTFFCLDTATKEVILCAGTLDTPKILMLSGIGPAEQLQKYGIPVIQDIPAIGTGLRDHMSSPMIYVVKDGITDRGSFYGNQKAMDVAMEQWKKDGTGPWATFGCQNGIGFFKSDRITSSDEFTSLPAKERNFLLRETVPHYEIITHAPMHRGRIPGLPEDYNYICAVVILLNNQSKGEVALQSSDPNVPLRFDPKLFSHPFDRRVAAEASRELSKVANHPSSFLDARIFGPQSDSDEDIVGHWKQAGFSTWHMTGTVKMGHRDDHNAAVDSKFCVRGIGHLRVADMSVVPLLTNNHVQATAYVTGVTCADTLIAEYNL
jgi:choline dehydrogenase-like flavoprotein